VSAKSVQATIKSSSDATESSRSRGTAVVVYCPTKTGGVRQVTESLALGIEQNGRSVIRIHNLWALACIAFSGRAYGVILSLEAGYLAPLFRRCVYILHGFPLVGAHSPARRVLIRMAARVARWGGARLVAVSHLTRAMHEKIYNIDVERVIFNGCSDSLNEYAYTTPGLVAKRKFITYVGRLIEAKGVRTIVDGFLESILPSLGYKLKIAGSGPLEYWIAEQSQRNGAIEPMGEISEETKERLLFESEAFVSLNNFEPMGVVFVEAALAGCKIVAPYCGGHREFVPPGYPVSLCDPTDLESVSAAFDRVPRLSPPAALGGERMFSYRDYIAPRYLRVLDGFETEVRGADVVRAKAAGERADH
jgi:glycosyltransferase involved in cell wall biosynthesis